MASTATEQAAPPAATTNNEIANDVKAPTADATNANVEVKPIKTPSNIVWHEGAGMFETPP